MIRTITKLTSSMGLALCLGLAFTPLGCGGSQGMSMDPIHGAGEGPTVDDSTVSQLRDCANEGAARLKETSYAFQFNVEVTESGQAGRVKLSDSYPGDRGIESCMARALEGMPVPLSVTRTLLPQAASAESRGFMGQAVPIAAAGGAAAGLAPVLIVVAAGISIIVIVTLYVTKETAEAERCKKVKQECIEYCSDTALPTPDYGVKFQNCKHDCLERHGCPRNS